MSVATRLLAVTVVFYAFGTLDAQQSVEYQMPPQAIADIAREHHHPLVFGRDGQQLFGKVISHACPSSTNAASTSS